MFRCSLARFAPKIHIEYCGGWGYGSRFRQVKGLLEQSVPGIVVTGSHGRTASFEVTDVDTGKNYWSKLNKDGHLDDPDDIDDVVAEIMADAEVEK